MVKSPKIYIRDSGILHSLLNISDYETLLDHPVIGASWEGFVLESLISHLSNKWRYSYYRTSSQAEIDVILEGPHRQVIAIEIKRSLAPKVTKGFHLASEDIQATRKFVLYPGSDRFLLTRDIEVIGLRNLLSEVIVG